MVWAINNYFGVEHALSGRKSTNISGNLFPTLKPVIPLDLILALATEPVY